MKGQHKRVFKKLLLLAQQMTPAAIYQDWLVLPQWRKVQWRSITTKFIS